MLNLNTKEKSLLEDAKEHETLCVAKYKDHAERMVHQKYAMQKHQQENIPNDDWDQT